MLRYSSTVIFVILCFHLNMKSQNLGGFSLYGYLETAIHPNGCNPAFVTNYPNDSSWVNFSANDSIMGYFNLYSTDTTGYDLLLETGYHPSNYIVILFLINGQYSLPYNITSWRMLPDIKWTYCHAFDCSVESFQFDHYIFPLDYSRDFGLTRMDTVIGLKIIFLATPGAPDFAGAYLINNRITNTTNQTFANSTVYPNPFTDHLIISSSDYEVSDINIYDITFRKIFTQQFSITKTLNTQEFISGIYICEIRYKNNQIKRFKILKL